MQVTWDSLSVGAGLFRKPIDKESQVTCIGNQAKAAFFILTGAKNLPVFAKLGAHNVMIGSAIKGSSGTQRLMDVIEASSIRCKRKAAQMPPGKNIGECSPSLDLQQTKSSGPFSPFLDLIEQQLSVRRDAQRL